MRDRQLRAAAKIGERTRELAKGLRSLQAGSGHNLIKIWEDWISSMALGLSNGVERIRFARGDERRRPIFDQREAEYMQIVERHGAETMAEFKRLFGLLVDELEEHRTDVLGQMLMALELGSDHAGQYFTPPDVCELMARMTTSVEDVQRAVFEQGYLSINEPAIGGGATVYPMIDVVLEAGLNPSEHMHVIGVDVDLHVLRIAYIQLSLLGVPAVLIHGDTLRLEEWDHYFTFAHVMNGWGRRLREKRPGIMQAIDKARALIDAVAAEPSDGDGDESPAVPEPPKPGQLGLFG